MANRNVGDALEVDAMLEGWRSGFLKFEIGILSWRFGFLRLRTEF